MAIKVPITRPALGDEEILAVTRVVKSGWLTQGAEVSAFEAEFAKAVGAEHAVAVCNCTVALELALRVVGVRPGDDVVTVSHSFVATANAIVTIGARPIFADVSATTLGMHPTSLERAITPDTKAVMCVHQIGMPCDLEKIAAICKDRGLPLVEDAACAIGSEIEIAGKWQRIGKPIGRLACFSMHPRKIVTTGDGGMITTSDEALAKRLRLLRQHAMSVPDTVRHHSDKVMFENYSEPAYNYRLTDLQASVGRPQLARLDAIVKERRRLADRYASALRDSPCIAPPVEPAFARSNWQSYPLSIRERCAIAQIDILQHLMDRGVAAKRGISNAHQEPAYAGKSNWACGPDGCAKTPCVNLAVSERLRDTTILIPLFHGMTDAEQDLVIAALGELKIMTHSKRDNAADQANFVRLSPDVELGEGVRIFSFVNMYGCKVGDGTQVGAFVEVQRGADIGKRCKISSHTFICEGVVIEDECFIGHGVMFINDRKPAAVNPDGSLKGKDDWTCESTIIRKRANIGSGAVIMCGIEIGEGALVGAGAVVTKSVPAGATVAGVPARVLAMSKRGS